VNTLHTNTHTHTIRVGLGQGNSVHWSKGTHSLGAKRSMKIFCS